MAGTNGNDFQQNAIVYLLNKKDQMANPRGVWVSLKNIIQVSIYFAVRKNINHHWTLHNDQFLFPKDNWNEDLEFQNDCLTFILFHEKNNIQSQVSTNYWIPFTEQEVNAQTRFESHFMTDFINGKISKTEEDSLFGDTPISNQPLEFSEEAKAVFDAGRELWKYYHEQPNVNVNASYYDIREYFQGRNEKGKMNAKSLDQIYTDLNAELKNKMSILTDKIKPKIYDYEFLKE